MKVFIYYDVSGSVPPALLEKFVAAGRVRAAQLDPKETKEFAFSWEVFEFGDPQKYLIGGTDTRAVREHFLKEASPGDWLLLYSDGYLPEMEPLPEGYTYEKHYFEE